MFATGVELEELESMIFDRDNFNVDEWGERCFGTFLVIDGSLSGMVFAIIFALLTTSIIVVGHISDQEPIQE